MIENLFLHEISRRCLFLYLIHVFRISVTGMPFFLFFFFCLSLSVAVAASSGIQRVRFDVLNQKASLSELPLWLCRPTDDPFWAFLSSGWQDPSSTPKQFFFSLGSWKKEGRSSSNSGYKIQKIRGWNYARASILIEYWSQKMAQQVWK